MAQTIFYSAITYSNQGCLSLIGSVKFESFWEVSHGGVLILARNAFATAKIRKEGSQKYLTVGANAILVILRSVDGRSSGHENVRWWMFKETWAGS